MPTITSAKFVKSVVGDDEALDDGRAQIALIGRSNVGKSSLINSLTKQKGLAKTSSFPGRTQEVNLFLINKSFYLVDLPGYGYAKANEEGRDKLKKIIFWYLFNSHYQQKLVLLVIDAEVGVTDNDKEILRGLKERNKNILIVANKVDKIKNAVYIKKMQELQKAVGDHRIIPYSVNKKIGVTELTEELFKR
ncbi:MAG: YihA family ribosome biogenesis GTP-binding protein [Candidatus Pacebacteria bacterium]|nr:YihA family ribosome biogenesis GTP-binding protein [Candidatus Paceibacterota bacterium]